MKFSCPSCQAKYQIADDKVTGRSMKMKCRKCGTVIPIQEDASIADADAARLSMLPRPSIGPEAPSPAAKKPSAPIGKAPLAPGAAAGKTSTTRAGLGARPAPGAKPAAPPGARAPATRPLTSSGDALAGGGAKARSPLARSPLTPSPSPSAASASLLGARPAGDIAVREVESEAPAPSSLPAADDWAGPPSLRRMASRAPQALPEWHAGIDGQAIGPLTREELRAKLNAGDASPETLVWREGMTGWVAFKDVPDLQDLLNAVIVAPAPFLAPEPDPLAAPLEPISLEAVQPAPKARDATPAAATVAASPGAPLASPVAPVAAAPLASSGLPGAANPAIPPAAGDTTTGVSLGLGVPEAPRPETVTAGAFVSSSVRHDRESIWARAREKPVNKWAIGFAVVSAVGFGMAIGIVFFSSEKTKVIKQIVEVPGAQQAVVDVPPPPPEDTLPEETSADKEAKAPATGTTKAPTSTNTTAGKTNQGEATAKSLTGLSGLSGLGGPQTGGPASTGVSSSSGQPLDASQVQSTVATYQNGVKRGCWQPALDTRDKSAPSSARVTVSITVAASGSVQSVSSTGDPAGYHGLASCIERRVAAWTFPRSSGSTTVKVPFVFAAQ